LSAACQWFYEYSAIAYVVHEKLHTVELALISVELLRIRVRYSALNRRKMAAGGVDVDDLRPVMGGSSLFEPDDVAPDDFECEADGVEDMNIETKVFGKDDGKKWMCRSADVTSGLRLALVIGFEVG